MKTLQYKMYRILTGMLFATTALTAQNVTTQTINTSKDVTIAVNTTNADVVIDTWNKNMVEVKSVTEQEVNPGDTSQGYKISVTSSEDKVTINGKHSSPYVSRGNNFIVFADGFDHDVDIDEDIEIIIPEIDIHSRINLDSLIMPLPAELPEINAFSYNFDVDFPEFDYKRYQTDKGYLQEWQKEMQTALKKMRVEVQANAKHNKLRQEELKERLEAAAERREKMMEKREEMMEKMAKEREERLKEAEKHREKRLKDVEKRRKELEKKRIKIKEILDEKDKKLPKTTIYLKVPKEATFEMNVKYGTVKFAN